MIRLTFLLVFSIALVACGSRDGSVTPAAPSQVTPGTESGPTTPAHAVINVGEPLAATFASQPLTYDLTAPSAGTLVLKLSWDPSKDGARLMITVANTPFTASAPNWSPVVGRVPVSKGQTYRVKIEEGVAPWDYGANDPFVLTTAIE
jgi:hypothetical protein